jgi:hypothetical protein
MELLNKLKVDCVLVRRLLGDFQRCEGRGEVQLVDFDHIMWTSILRLSYIIGNFGLFRCKALFCDALILLIMLDYIMPYPNKPPKYCRCSKYYS